MNTLKLLLSDLKQQPIDKLYICSIELGLYQARAVIDNVEHVIWENEDKALLTRNLNAMREAVANLNVRELILRHDSPYDEMIGQPVGEGNRLEVPLSHEIYPNVPAKNKDSNH